MKPQAKVILDSLSPAGIRLTTMEVVMHRFVLAEFNTHRVFSRNSASSRAIPVRKMLERYQQVPALPVELVSEKAGMSGGEPLTDMALAHAVNLLEDIQLNTWRLIYDYLNKCQDQELPALHKSILNRYMEPMQWHTVVVTSTEWDNFFAQRCHPNAQPEMRMAAEAMQLAYKESTPRERTSHLPYLFDEQQLIDEGLLLWDRAKISVARCARVSYLTHDGVRDSTLDLNLYDKLTGSNPPHWSPLEHVAFTCKGYLYSTRNFAEDWVQMRQLLEDNEDLDKVGTG